MLIYIDIIEITEVVILVVIRYPCDYNFLEGSIVS